MSRRIEDLHPEAARRALALLSESERRGVRLMVTSTLRSRAHQRALHSQGRLALAAVNALRSEAGLPPIAQAQNRIVTRASRSLHELGLAFDIALADGQSLSWDAKADLDRDCIPDYEEAGRIGESLGLAWGGRFRMRDLCHFEWTGGLAYEELWAGRTPTAADDAPASAGAASGADANGREEAMAEQGNQAVKSGVRSTEFYVALLGAVVPVLNAYLGLAIPVEGVLSIAGVAASYIVSRAAVKRR